MIPIEITPWHWVGFIACVLLCIAVDLGAFNRRPRVVTFQEALVWSAVWFTLAMLFAAPAGVLRAAAKTATEFVTGYVIELSLSLDNVFVIALIFTAFQRAAANFSTGCCSGASSARWSCAAR